MNKVLGSLRDSLTSGRYLPVNSPELLLISYILNLPKVYKVKTCGSWDTLDEHEPVSYLREIFLGLATKPS